MDTQPQPRYVISEFFMLHAKLVTSFPTKEIQSVPIGHQDLPFDPTIPEHNTQAVQANSAFTDIKEPAPVTPNGISHLPPISNLTSLSSDQNPLSSAFDQPILPPSTTETMTACEPITLGGLVPRTMEADPAQHEESDLRHTAGPEVAQSISIPTQSIDLPVVEPPVVVPVSAPASAPISALLDPEPVQSVMSAPVVSAETYISESIPSVTSAIDVTPVAQPSIAMDGTADAMEVDQPSQLAPETIIQNDVPSSVEPFASISDQTAVEVGTSNQNPIQQTKEESMEPAITQDISSAPIDSQTTLPTPSESQITLPTQPKLSHPRDEEESNGVEPASKRAKPDDYPLALDTSSFQQSSNTVVDTPMTMEAPDSQIPIKPLSASSSRPVTRNGSRPVSRAGSRAQSKGSSPAPASATTFLPPVQKNANGFFPAPTAREHNPEWDEPITVPQRKHLQRGVQNAKKGHHAGPFSNPVDPVLLNIPTYFDIIKKPMDLKHIDNKLKNNEYVTVNEFLSDFDVMVDNSIRFNGPDHNVSQHGIQLRHGIDRNISSLPRKDFVEPNASEKKAKKMADNPPKRRESRSLPIANAGSARSPTSSTTFALKSDGVPLIRRDSTVQDGRPRREIHPPAPKDLPYSSMKPKRKKYIAELKFCDKVYEELVKPKFQNVNWPFLAPVDPVALNIPQYLKVIKKPMDMQTIGQKLKNGEYENAKEFEDDFRLMINNCLRFNPADHPVHIHGKEYLQYFEQEWKDKAKWVKEHTPRSADQSPESSDEDEQDEEEDEEDEVEPEEEDDGQLAKLQETLALVSAQIQNLTQKNKKTPPADKKKSKPKTSKKDTKKPTSSSKPTKKSNSASAKNQKAKNISWEDKMSLSDRINDLNQTDMQHAMAIIKKGMPNLSVSSHSPAS